MNTQEIIELLKSKKQVSDRERHRSSTSKNFLLGKSEAYSELIEELEAVLKEEKTPVLDPQSL